MGGACSKQEAIKWIYNFSQKVQRKGITW